MSRISYSEDMWASIRWGGAAKQAIYGKRGQTILRELRQALLDMPRKRLAYSHLVSPLGDYCVLGALAQSRGYGRWTLEHADDNHDSADWAKENLGLTYTLAWELMEKNDEGLYVGRREPTPEQRYKFVLEWVERHIKPPTQPAPATRAEGSAANGNS